jgi:hypothetical protein
MLGNFADCALSLPMFDVESRFSRLAFLSIFLLELQAVVPLFLTDNAPNEGAVAMLSGACILAFQMAFLARKELLGQGILRSKKSPLLAGAAWLSAIAAGGVFYAVFWDHSVAQTTPSVLSYLILALTYVELNHVRLICAATMACSIAVVVVFRAGAKPAIHAHEGEAKPDKWNYAMIALSSVGAATFQAWNNHSYLNIYSVWVFYAALIAAAFFIYSFAWLIGKGLLHENDIALVSSVFTFCLVLNPSAQGFFKRLGTPALVMAMTFLPAVAWATSRKRSGRNAAIVFAIFALFPLIGILRGEAAKLMSDLIEARSPAPTVSGSGEAREFPQVRIEEGDRASVFMLVYDSLPDMKTLEDLRVDPEPLAKLLSGYGFKIYPNTYSVGHHSLQSMGNTYDIAAHDYQIDIEGVTTGHWSDMEELRDLCAGNSKAFRIFSENSYGTCNIQSDYMTQGKSYADDHFPRLDYNRSIIDSMAILLKGIFFGEFKFDAEGFRSFEDDDFHYFFRETAVLKEGPWFTAMHVDMPGHAQISGKLLPNETELFINRYKKTLPDIRGDIEAILENKPSSIIIVMGDHGPHLTGDGRVLVNYLPEDITELMIRDRFGTLVAIRWPDPERADKYDDDLIMNQDIFPVVFAYLADSDEPLRLMVKEKKAILKNHVFIDNGLFIPAGL